jgi:hypothetical protein
MASLMLKRWFVRLLIVGTLASGAGCLISVKDYPLARSGAAGGGVDSGSSGDGPLVGEAGEENGGASEGGAVGDVPGASAGSADAASGSGTGGSGSTSGKGGSGETGGTSSAGSIGMAGFTNTAGATTVGPNLIDDFEDNDKIIVVVNTPRRDGIWDTNNDMTVGGVQTPAPTMFKPTLLGANAPYAGDVYAAHSVGSGFSTFGAYMTVSMRAVAVYADTPVYDASSYKGISFLAKAASASSKSMRVRFVSGDTDPRGKKCMLGGAQTTACYNHYYAPVTLTPAWATYAVDFASFVQGGDGMVNPSIDLQEMYGLDFSFAASNDYDIWLDDLTFTK